MYAHAHARTHTYTHTNAHRHTHTRTHARTHTHTPTQSRPHESAHARVQAPTRQSKSIKQKDANIIKEKRIPSTNTIGIRIYINLRHLGLRLDRTATRPPCCYPLPPRGGIIKCVALAPLPPKRDVTWQSNAKTTNCTRPRVNLNSSRAVPPS